LAGSNSEERLTFDLKKRLFIGCLPGFEDWLRQEAEELGARCEAVPGGLEAEVDGPLRQRLFRGLGVASQILERVGRFPARHFSQLERRAAELPWQQWIASGQRVEVRARCQRSKLYHSGAVAERVAAVIAAAVPPAPNVGSTIRVHVQVRRDRAQISLDRAGMALHKRGYRQAGAKAPLREDVARALLHCSGWARDSPVFDPFCGSGTLLIEAARWARGIAPGADRHFAWQDSPDYLGEESLPPAAADAPACWGSDRDSGAVKAAADNARRAGCEPIVWQQAAAGASPFWARARAHEAGMLVFNPPYGRRVSRGKDLAPLFHRVRAEIDALGAGWKIAMVCPPGPGPAILGLVSRLMTEVGGQKVHFWTR
jgi:putative N6-adenine-specific DNA methylase